jgi:hypothetical protein
MILWQKIRFADSATRHGIARARSRYVVEHCGQAFSVPAAVDPKWQAERLLSLGDDMKGIPLEVMGIQLEDDSLLGIHAMKLRPRYRELYRAAIPYRLQ